MPLRTFKGTCTLCGASVDKRLGAVHHIGCAPAHDIQTGREGGSAAVKMRSRSVAVGDIQFSTWDRLFPLLVFGRYTG